MKNVIMSILLAMSLTACTNAGPYVTNISSDGKGGLYIEKCGVYMNGFTVTVSTGECTSQHIQVSN